MGLDQLIEEYGYFGHMKTIMVCKGELSYGAHMVYPQSRSIQNEL
jgi:hypothetical protein